jgi:dTDP-4-dehydrorhamnose 3,5-epimerase
MPRWFGRTFSSQAGRALGTWTVGAFRDEDGMRQGSGIVDVTVRALDPIDDIRGALCEIHRDEWKLAPRPVQWDFITTKPQVLRGMHVHYLRWDYIIVLDGHATVALKDVRRGRGSFARNMMIEMTGERPTLVTIPPGVAHGIFANGALRYLYGLTAGWDGSDEDLGCRYDDPALAIKWPAENPVVLARDLDLPDFATLVRNYEAVAAAPADRENAPA